MKQQQGATMIIVLIVLLLVAIAGTIALRSGLFGMRLSTNSQVGNLLIQNNDSALFKFEGMEANVISQNFALGGMFHYLLDPTNATDELVFCYDARQSDTFNIQQASIINEDDSTERTNFCDTNKSSSERGAVITQVHMRRNYADSQISEGYTINNSTPTVQLNISLSLSAISVIPAFGNHDKNAVNDCFKHSAFKKTASTTTIAECFNGLGIAHDVQSTDFKAGNSVHVERFSN